MMIVPNFVFTFQFLNSLRIICTESQKIIITEHLYGNMEYEDTEVLG